MQIREASSSDLESVLAVETAAFGGDTEAELVRRLLTDPSARPTASLLAIEDGQAVGHILFTAARLSGHEGTIQVSLLAPLAVVTEAQSRGIGGQLIERGLQLLSNAGVGLVFVLGHPGYYPRHGFAPAGRLGFEAPYPIPDQHADAWMVRALRPGLIGALRGRVLCADEIDKPEYWQD